MKNFLLSVFKRFYTRNCALQAASLAYSTLLSIVPLIMVLFYILSFFPLLQNTGKQIEGFVLNNFVANSAQSIEQELQVFLKYMTALSWINIMSLGAVALLLIFNMVTAVNNIWEVKLRAAFAWSTLLYFVILLLSPIVFGVLLLASSYLTSLPLLSHLVQIDFLRKPIISVFPFIIEWLVFSAFNWLMPSCQVKIKFACIAGLITTVFFEIAKWGFVEYFRFFPTYRLIYGALATIPIFLVWIYLSWLIILIGTLICHQLQNTKYLREH